MALHAATIADSKKREILREYEDLEDAFREEESLRGEELPRRLDEMDRILRELKERGGSYLPYDEDGFPESLLDIPNPPVGLFCLGQLPRRKPYVAVIGTRRATPYGISESRRFARAAARMGAVVVSGMARGIDAAAQHAALGAGGSSVAVLASGVFVCYPEENRSLYLILQKKGAVLSEKFPREKARSYDFPIRNRLITGLSHCLVLVEGGLKSGSASSVDHALSQGREILALPGQIDNPCALLPNRMIRDGARPLLEDEDLREVLLSQGFLTRRNAEVPEEEGGVEGRILKMLEEGEKGFSELIEGLSLSDGQLNAALLRLELSGRIYRSELLTYALLM